MGVSVGVGVDVNAGVGAGSLACEGKEEQTNYDFFRLL